MSNFTTTSGLIWCHPADKRNLNHRHRAICKMSSKHFGKMSRWQHKVRQTAAIFSRRATFKRMSFLFLRKWHPFKVRGESVARSLCGQVGADVSVKTETKHKGEEGGLAKKTEELPPSLSAYAALLLRDNSAAKIITKKEVTEGHESIVCSVQHHWLRNIEVRVET